MSYDPETYRDPGVVRGLVGRLHRLAGEAGRPVRFMHVCGTHEHEIGRHALRSLLPEGVEVLPGPGCPVCVCDATFIDAAIRLALEEGCTVTTFGDLLGVPGSMKSPRGGPRRVSLLDARAEGGDVRPVLGVFDALRLAQAEPGREVVFLSAGFETTVVAVAAAVARGVPDNFHVIEANYYTPPATELLTRLPGFSLDGFLLPGHASVISGLAPYAHLPERGLACAVAGFEPVDILSGLVALLEQVRDGKPELANAYPRLVRFEGNAKARAELDRVFELVPRTWRGIGAVAASGFDLRPEFRSASAAKQRPRAFRPGGSAHPAGCRCGEVTLGQVQPEACPLFGKVCTLDQPYGPCMVSHEGTCRAAALYGGRAVLHVQV
ncbi:MAG TPA: hydrogenase formation protein HypD [Deinococcales bacterium]|nr:hydrogenase formation protein HypD [Deinococcales bacterium]